jgi:uroporphyrin-III C-methyltransferase/precorrin-2 dehydrogenase/sirohydrochlorin ferrochelatase
VIDARIPSDTRPPRMNKLSRLPVFYLLDGKRALVAGGNAAAAWKAELLSAAGAAVDVYAQDISEEMALVAADPPRGPIVLRRRDWGVDDLRGAAFAVGAFDEDRGAGIFADAARACGVPVNVIDRPTFCDFSFGAIVNRSPLVIGISTDGAAPVFAQAIRAKLEALLPKGFALWAEAAARWRAAVKASGLPFAGRRRFWQLFTAKAIVDPNRAPTNDDFVSFLNDVRGRGTAVEAGSVSLVGAGPGDPELLTLRAVRALQSADVVLFDDLVSREVLDFARREAKKLLVGKTGYGPSCTQDDINALMVKLARSGKRVVRLKGGDPLIFARGAEEIAVCREAGIAVDVVPGITAAQGAASRLGVALTGRAQARRLQYLTGHAHDGKLPEDIDWRSLADPATTTAIYMPAKTLAALVRKAIEQGLDPQTPAIAVARATRPDQAFVADTVRELPSRLARQNLPGPILVMLGRALAAADVKSQAGNEQRAATKA